jgi:flagellar biosynthesis chaperone FliJ
MDPVTGPDDFLIIERPPNVQLKGEPTTSAGGAVDSGKEPSQSLLSKLTGARRSDPRTWPPEALAELQRREEIYHQMRAYIDKLEERIQSQDQEISALNTALADTEQKLDVTRGDLNASRAFVSSEGTGDAQHLIKSIRELNSSIDDFAFRMTQEVLPEAATSRVVTKTGLEGLHKAYPALIKLATFTNTAFKVQATVGDFVHPFICNALCSWVNDLVFMPFVPGLDKERSRIFHEIYELVNENEPQERSARWRAITYAHADTRRDDKFFCGKAGDEFLLRMASALTPLIAPETITFETLKSELGDVVRAVFEDAIKLQDKAKTGYMSWDYTPFMPQVDQPFVPIYMNTADACADVRQGGRGKASHAILVIGLGMQAWKSVVKEDKTMGRDTNIAVKATVICGNWNPTV